MHSVDVKTDLNIKLLFNGQDINEFLKDISSICHDVLFYKSLKFDDNYDDAEGNEVSKDEIKNVLSQFECAIYEILDKLGD